MDYLPPFEKALNDHIAEIHTFPNIPGVQNVFYIGLTGSFGENMVSPRNLTSAHLGKTICVEAIVTRCKF